MARSACESASVWFWQTRQRSSEARRCMRASTAGSAAAGAASLALAQKAARHSIKVARSLSIELPQHGEDARLDDLRRQRPHLLEAHHALLVDDEGFGHAVDAEVDAHLALVVEGG